MGTFVFVLALAVSLQTHAEGIARGPDAAASRAALERQLRNLDRQWLDAQQHGNLAALTRMVTSQYVELIPGGRVVTKPSRMNWLAGLRRMSGRDITLDDFKLEALYGNIALATDHMTQKDPQAYPRGTASEIVGTKVFAKENGKWKVAASILLALGHVPPVAVSRAGSKKTGLGHKYPDLEKQLRELDRKWEQAIRNHDVAFMRQLYTPQCVVVWPNGQKVSKQDILSHHSGNARSRLNIRPFPYDFQLLSVYGDFAIASDRTVFKGNVLPGGKRPGPGGYQIRAFKFFVRDNGVWRSAGAADVPIARP